MILHRAPSFPLNEDCQLIRPCGRDVRNADVYEVGTRRFFHFMDMPIGMEKSLACSNAENTRNGAIHLPRYTITGSLNQEPIDQPFRIHAGMTFLKFQRGFASELWREHQIDAQFVYRSHLDNRPNVI